MVGSVLAAGPLHDLLGRGTRMTAIGSLFTGFGGLDMAVAAHKGGYPCQPYSYADSRRTNQATVGTTNEHQ